MMYHFNRLVPLLMLAALLITACQPLVLPVEAQTGEAQTGDAARQAFEFTAIDAACPDGNIVLSESPMMAGRSETGFTQEPDELYFAMTATFFPEAYPDATWDVPGDGVDLPDGSFIALHRGVGTGMFAESGIIFVATPASDLDDLPCEPVGPVVKLDGFIIMPATLPHARVDTVLEANKLLAHRYLEEMWDKGNMDIAEEILADDFVDHYPRPGNAADKAGLMADAASFHEVGNKNRLDDLMVTSDSIILRVTVMVQGADEELKEGPAAVVLLGVADGQIIDRRVALFGWE